MVKRIVRYGLVVAASVTLVGLGSSAFAQPATQQEKNVSFGAQINWSDDADLGVGGRVIVSLNQFMEGLEAVGSFDYYFPGDGGVDTGGVDVDLQYFEINANAVYKFTLSSSSLRPYVGGGLNIAHAKGGVGIDLGDAGSFDFSASETRVGLNVLGGVLFAKRFFAEAKFELGGGETFVLTGGIRF
jgi:hypothetical protein